MNQTPRMIAGGLHVDDRGIVSFVNDFDFKGVDRFYMIRAHHPNQPRGWVGHKRDQKWFSAVEGTWLIAIVQPDNWDGAPASNLPVQRFVLSSLKPAVLHVPPGCATAQVALSEAATLMVFSSGSMAQAKEDDYRFNLDAWPVTEDLT